MRDLKRYLALALTLFVVMGASLGGKDVLDELQRYFGAQDASYVYASCLPAVPTTSLTFDTFACTAFVRDDSSIPGMHGVVQPTHTVGPLNAGDGTYWLGVHYHRSAAVSGWTREAGTHYVWKKNATRPANPSGGVIVAKVTVSTYITVVDDLRPTSPVDDAYVNVLDPAFGVVADGTTDDLAGLLAAASNAAARGKALWLPGEKSYAFDGQFLITTSLHSDGATLLPLETDGVSWGNTLAAVNATDVIIEGVTVDTTLRTAGIYLNACDRCIVRNVTVNNTTDGGIRVFYSDDVVIENAHIEDVRYGSSGGADGIYFTASLRPTARNNTIHDFRRIGVVCEQDGTTNSEDCNVLYNTIYNAHDLDDSVSEFNAAVWFENTDGGRIVGNTIYDISGNAGQTARTPYGIVVSSGQERPSIFVIRDNTIDFGDGVAASGFPISVSGTSQYASVLIEGGYVGYAGFGVSIGGGLDAVFVTDVRFDNLNYTSTTSAAVSIDTAGSARIKLSGIYPTNITKTSGDAQDVNIAAGGAGSLAITNSNVGLVNHGVASALALLTISDSTIEFGNSSTDGTFDATVVRVTNSKITPTSGRSDTVFNLSGGAITAQFDNSTFDGGTLTVGGSSAFNAHFNNVRFVNGASMTVDTTAATRLFFNNCVVDEYDATYGFLFMNFSSNANDELYVRGCDFTRSTDVTPLKQWTEGPNVVVLHDNTYNSTLLEDFSAGGTADSVLDNVAY